MDRERDREREERRERDRDRDGGRGRRASPDYGDYRRPSSPVRGGGEGAKDGAAAGAAPWRQEENMYPNRGGRQPYGGGGYGGGGSDFMDR